MPEFEMQEVDSSVLSVDLVHNGVFIAGGENGRILLGDFRTPHKVVQCVETNDAPVAAIKFLGDGSSAVCGSGVWDLRGSEVVPLGNEKVTALDASGDMACLASNANLELWSCSCKRKKLVFCFCFCFLLFLPSDEQGKICGNSGNRRSFFCAACNKKLCRSSNRKRITCVELKKKSLVYFNPNPDPF